MINWISNNKEWLFGGIGVTIILFIINFFIPKNKKAKNIINIYNNNNIGKLEENKKSPKRDLGERKKLINILFIDDDTNFKVVKILIKSGWVNTKIKKDIYSLDDRLVKDSHICFVDIQGVANDLFPKDQGLGLAGALKDRYPEKKIIVYSSQRTGDRFHELLKKVDATLSKDADPYEFENLVDNFSKEIFD